MARLRVALIITCIMAVSSSTLDRRGILKEDPAFCPGGGLSCFDRSKCIHVSWVCDGDKDCVDGSDEAYCDGFLQEMITHLIDEKMNETMERATITEEATESSSTVGPSATSPMPSTQDPVEHSAPYTLYSTPSPIEPDAPSLRQCRKGEFLCAQSGACIPGTWKCDGERDCDDGYDEKDCTKDQEAQSTPIDLPLQPNTSAEIKPCEEGEFTCKGGACINSTLVCDGKTDCPLGDDERENCNHCATANCSHTCTNTSSGPKCSCPQDMTLGTNAQTCEEEENAIHVSISGEIRLTFSHTSGNGLLAKALGLQMNRLSIDPVNSEAAAIRRAMHS